MSQLFCTHCGGHLNKDDKFCQDCGTAVSINTATTQQRPNGYKIPIITTIILLVLVFSMYLLVQNTQTPATYTPSVATTTAVVEKQTPANQNKIASAVVNVFCRNPDNSTTGGSGTVLNEKSLILTNAHIINITKSGKVLSDTCLVSFPDEKGQAKEIYIGKPVVVPKLSVYYDLAFIKITDVYDDKDDDRVFGKYPRTFENSLDTNCENSDVTLGEPVRVFGYPNISGGGYYLTITDGIVSSLLNDGTIVTSAKIDHGNSGGIAVDENGCFIGVPSMVQSGEMESLGMIIPNETIFEFTDKVSSYINK